PQGAAHGCTAFSAEAGCPFGKSRRLRGPGARHRARRRGVLSLRQVSLHKQRKVARAVTARKPLILMSREPEQQAGQDPPYGAVGGDTEEQGRLAALAPSSGASRHLLPQAGEGLSDRYPASGRRVVRSISRKREKGWSTGLPQAEKTCATQSAAGIPAGGASRRASRLPANSATSSSVNPPQNVE